MTLSVPKRLHKRLHRANPAVSHPVEDSRPAWSDVAEAAPTAPTKPSRPIIGWALYRARDDDRYDGLPPVARFMRIDQPALTSAQLLDHAQNFVADRNRVRKPGDAALILRPVFGT